MMKICPRCAGTFAGGSFCPGCGVKQALIDMSSDEARPYLRDADMRRAVMTHYVERSGMVRSALGALVGVLGGLFIVRFAVGADSTLGKIAWLSIASGWAAFFAGGSLFLARRMAEKANEGSAEYVCIDEDAPVEKFRPPPRRGFRWLTW
jgi:hypothetical protein